MKNFLKWFMIVTLTIVFYKPISLILGCIIALYVSLAKILLGLII